MRGGQPTIESCQLAIAECLALIEASVHVTAFDDIVEGDIAFGQCIAGCCT